MVARYTGFDAGHFVYGRGRRGYWTSFLGGLAEICGRN